MAKVGEKRSSSSFASSSSSSSSISVVKKKGGQVDLMKLIPPESIVYVDIPQLAMKLPGLRSSPVTLTSGSSVPLMVYGSSKSWIWIVDYFANGFHELVDADRGEIISLLYRYKLSMRELKDIIDTMLVTSGDHTNNHWDWEGVSKFHHYIAGHDLRYTIDVNSVCMIGSPMSADLIVKCNLTAFMYSRLKHGIANVEVTDNREPYTLLYTLKAVTIEAFGIDDDMYNSAAAAYLKLSKAQKSAIDVYY